MDAPNTPLNYQNAADSKLERKGLLREMFGPSRAEIWKQLADGVNGQFINGGWFGNSRVTARHGQWTITLDSFKEKNGRNVNTYSRLRAPYVNADGFRFHVSRTDIFRPIGRLLGMQDVEIGDKAFDDTFVIKCNNEPQVRALLANPRLRALLTEVYALSFGVKDDEGWFGQTFPQGVDELYFVTSGLVRHVESLQRIFDLFAETLNTLCHIGSAYESDPGLQLK